MRVNVVRMVNREVLLRPVDRASTVKREGGERAPTTREEGTKMQKRRRVRAMASTVMFTMRVIPAFSTKPASYLPGVVVRERESES